MHDLIAKSTTNRLLIRRSVAITRADRGPRRGCGVAGGTAMTAVPLTINRLSGSETLYTFHDILLAHDFAFFSGSSTTLHTAPPSLLVPQDFQFLGVQALTATSNRSAFTVFTGTENTFTLMPALTGITFAATGGVMAASWGALPTYTNLSLGVFTSVNARDSRQSAAVSKSWLDATATTRLAVDVDPPGMDPAWKIDVTGPHTRELRVTNQTSTSGYDSSVREGANGAVARTPPRDQRRTIRERMARAQ